MRGSSNDTIGTLHEGLSGELPRTGFDRCEQAVMRSNDTVGTFARGLSVDWPEQACSWEAVAMTQLEHCTKGFLAIGKNKFDYARP